MWKNKNKKGGFGDSNGGRPSPWNKDKDFGELEAQMDLRLIETQTTQAIDAKYGFERINSEFGREEVGYLINMHSTEVVDQDKRLLGAVDYYFIQEDGKRFKVFVPFLPYFYIKVKIVAL
jgi:hypothetical protein